MNLIKKTALMLLSSILFLNSLFLPIYVFAQEDRGDGAATGRSDETDSSNEDLGTWYNQDFKSWLEKVDDESNPSEIFGERYTSAQVQWIIYSLFSFILHTTLPENVVSCVFSNTLDLSVCKDAIEGFLKSEKEQDATSVVRPDKNLWQLVFDSNRQFSGISYVKSKFQNFGVIPIANAQQGFGFDALKPIQDMWKASRDVAFGLFVLAAVIFSFMIMFRVKISPQVVISVQSAIPKMFFALILVTFSYAISGFLIDLMYVVIGILSIIIKTFMPATLGGFAPTTGEIFSILTVGQPFGEIGLNVQFGILGLMTIYLAPLILTLLIITTIGIFASPVTYGLSFFIPFIILIIVIIVAIWMILKTVWALLKAFVNILLSTIFAPLQLALGVLVPNIGFNSWLRSYISNLSVFVVTGALYWFSVIFLLQGMEIGLNDAAINIAQIASGNFFGQAVGGASLVASLSNFNASWPPLLGAGGNLGVGFLFLGVSFTLFTLIPKATEIVQGFISGKPFAYGSAIGESITGPFAAGLRLMTAAQQIGTSYTTRFGTNKAGESQEKATNLNDNRKPPEGTTSM